VASDLKPHFLPKTDMKPSFIKNSLLAACFVALGTPAFASSFTVSSASTTAQTLASGQTGTITSSGTLTVSGATVAVTITGSNASFTNSGTLLQSGSGRAIRDNTGVTNLTITNNAGALIQTADADVIQMNKSPASVTLNNSGTMTSLNASAGGSQVVDFNAITSGSNIVNNYATGVMLASEADAVRPGVNGAVNNWGTIKSTTNTGSSSDGIDAQTNSGVSITNAGLIEGGRHGVTGGNTTTGVYAMSVTNNTGGVIQGDNGSGLNIDGINGSETVTVVNHGTITGNGVTGDGDGVDVDGLVNLTNTGTIKSINSYSATTTAQSEGVTVGGGTIINSGTIAGCVANGNTNAVGRGITIAGVDKDTNDNAIPVQAMYGPTVITNSGLIQGQTDSGIAFSSGSVSGFTATINNQAGGVIEGGGSTAAAIQTGADDDTINNYGTIQADSSNKAIDMGAGNNTLNILGGSASIVGNVSGGVGGTNTLVVQPGAGNTFQYAGVISNFSLAKIQSGTFNLAGVMTTGSTTVSSGGILMGSGTISGLVAVTAGGTLSHGHLTLQTGLDLSGGGTYLWQLTALADGATGAAGTDFDQIVLTGGNLTLSGSSALTLDFSSLDLLGDPNSKIAFWQTNHTWTIIAGSGATNLGTTDFSEITDATYEDGTFTTSTDENGNVVLSYEAVPEPSALWLVTAPMALFLFSRIRRRRQLA
jgi:hypothetical protein